LGQLQEIDEELVELGYEILDISPDRPERVNEIAGKRDYNYRLFSDAKLEATARMGIVFRVDDETVERYKGFGIDLEESSGESHHLLPVPSVFIVDRKGEIRFAYVDPVYQRRIDPQTLLAAARFGLK
jgi:peroxiredoxin